jgi:hypothetical protein
MANEVFGTGVSVRAKVSGEYITIGCADRCSFQLVNEIIGKTDVNAGLYRKKRVRLGDCNGSVDGIITTESSATRLSVIGLSSDVNNWSDFNLLLEGTGGLSVTAIDPPGDVTCESIKSDWWTTTEGLSGIAGTGHAGLSFAGHDVIEVDREGLQYDIITTGTPGNRQAKYTGGSTITFDPSNPFLAGETIFVIWVEDGS